MATIPRISMESRERLGTVLLVIATVIVAGSIILDGTIARALNGAGGLAWFAGAGFLVLAAIQASRRWTVWALALTLTALVAFVVTPSDFLPSVVGFGVAGGVLALAAGSHEVLWPKVVVGLYLPFHIGTAVLQAVGRTMSGTEASIRTEPPPTAAMVPLSMVVAAMCGGWLVAQGRQRRGARRLSSVSGTRSA